MATITANAAQEQLDGLIERVAAFHDPIIITGERHNAVLISEEDWNAIEETLHLVSIPGMRDSIVDGLAEPLEEYGREPEARQIRGCLDQLPETGLVDDSG